MDASTAADGRVHQVNISPGGVPKLAVAEARIERMGLVGDAHDHYRSHGGPHRAVCLLALEAIERVAADGHRIEPGAVGENLTTVGIELSVLPVGTRLAIGDEVLLELSSPANPCDVIRDVFVRGKSGRISILLHPMDSRMYARVVTAGTVREGDAIRVLPPTPDSRAGLRRELDLLDHIDREAWLTVWRAAAAAGEEIRIVDHGDLAAAAAPDLPGDDFNRAFGIDQIPIVLPEIRAFFADAGTDGWVLADADDPPWPGAVADAVGGVHVAGIDAALARAAAFACPDGLAIRAVDPTDRADVDRWAELTIAGFGLEGHEADAMRRLNRHLAAARGEHEFIASLDGVDVGVSALFTRRRVGWLGGGTVLPEARGRGVQRAMIADRIRRAADGGAHQVMATADLDTVSATNLEALGLRRIWARGRFRLDGDSSPADPATIPA